MSIKRRRKLFFILGMIPMFFCANQVLAQTYQYSLISANIQFVGLPTPVGGKYLPTNFSTISKPLIVEHFKSNCALFSVASQIHSGAGNVADVLFGGDLPSGYGQPSNIFTKATFTQSDFPIVLETNVYSDKNVPEYNEVYFWIGPSKCEYFGAPTYNLSGQTAQKEGVIVGGRPFELYIDNHRTASQSSVAVNQVTHNHSSNGKWYNFKVQLNSNGTTLEVEQVYIDGKTVLSAPVKVTGLAFLDDFRLALCSDDLVQDFKIILNAGKFSGKITASDSVICEGNNISFQNNTSYGVDPTVSYTWQIEGGSPGTSTQKDPGLIFFAVAGTYTVQLEVEKDGSKDTLKREIVVLPLPKPDLGRDTVLCDSLLTLKTKLTYSQYLWNDGSIKDRLPVNKTGQYWVEVRNGICAFSDTINIVFDQPKIDLPPDTTWCFNQPLFLSINNMGADILWSTGNQSQLITINNVGKYWVRLTKGKCVDSDTILVGSTDTFSFSLPNDTLLCEGDTFRLDLKLPAGYKLTWKDGSKELQKTIVQSNVLEAEVVGCSKQTDQVRLTFHNCCVFDVWVPNAFTPNNDLLNEQIAPIIYDEHCLPIQDYHFEIFDMWGKKVFESTNRFEVWDGFIDDFASPINVYVWLLNGKVGEDFIRKKGTVTLLR